MTNPTDEEVEAALVAWRRDWKAGPPEQDERSAMRAALTAAAQVRERAEQPNQRTLRGMNSALAFIDFVNLWCSRKNVTFSEVVSVIKNHPVARARLQSASKPALMPIYGATEDTRPSEEVIREQRDAWPDRQAEPDQGPDVLGLRKGEG